MTEFYDLGAHCSMIDCREKDFLPFECNYCHKKFCLQHRSHLDHKCPNYQSDDRQVPVCPICNQAIPIRPNENVNVIINEHINRGCPKVGKTVTDRHHPVSAADKKKLKGIKICGVDNCSQKGVIKCKGCGKVFCIGHRLEEDHTCTKEKKQKSASSSGLSGITNYLGINNTLADIHKQRQKQEQDKQERKEKLQQREIERAVKSGDYHKQSKLLQNAFQNKKTTPIGQSSIEYQDRFLLDVYFPMRSKTPPIHMYFHKNWKVGRVLDMIAVQGKVDNNNSTTLDITKTLNLFNLTSTELLPTNKTLQELANEGIIESGDGIILEYGDVLDPAIHDAFMKAVQNPKEANNHCIIS